MNYPQPWMNRWTTDWDLPTTQEAFQSLAKGQSTIKARLALVRDGLLTAEQMGGAQWVFEAACREWSVAGRPTAHTHLINDRQRWEFWEAQRWPEPIRYTHAAAGENPEWTEAFQHKAWWMVWALHSDVNPWSPLAEDDQGVVTMFDWAVVYNDPDLVRVLLAHPNAPSAQELTEQRPMYRQPLTLLQHAAQFSNPEVLELLLDYGVDWSYKGKSQQPILFHAKYELAVRALMERGASLSDKATNGLTVHEHWAKGDSAQQKLVEAIPMESTDGVSRETVALFGASEQADWFAIEKATQADPTLHQLRTSASFSGGKTLTPTWWTLWALRHQTVRPKNRYETSRDQNWNTGKQRVYEATRQLNAALPDAALTQETIPGIPDGWLWSTLFHWANEQNSNETRWNASLGRYETDAQDRKTNTVYRNEWNDRLHRVGISMAPDVLLLRYHTLMRETKQVQPWRDHLEEVFTKWVATNRSSDVSRWVDASRATASRSKADPSKTCDWSRLFDAVATVLQDSTLRKSLGLRTLEILSDNTEWAERSIDASVRERLIPGLVLSLSEQVSPPRNRAQYVALLQGWSQGGLMWPDNAWGKRSLRTAMEKAPEVAGFWSAQNQADALAELLAPAPEEPAAPRRRNRL